MNSMNSLNSLNSQNIQIAISNAEVDNFEAMTAGLDATKGTGGFAPWHVGLPKAVGLRAYGALRVRSAHYAPVILRSRGPAEPR